MGPVSESPQWNIEPVKAASPKVPIPFRDHYLGHAANADAWRASPARIETLAGLPPAYVLTAGADPLRDEGEEYARWLEQAGVPVMYRTFPGQFHGFFTMGKLLDQANIAARDIGAWLRALSE